MKPPQMEMESASVPEIMWVTGVSTQAHAARHLAGMEVSVGLFPMATHLISVVCAVWGSLTACA